MQNPSQKKPLIILGIVVVVALLIYFYMSGNPKDADPSLVSTDPKASEASAAAARVLVLLNQVSALKIETDIFNSQAFKSLVDHTVDVPEQNVGKANPFSAYFGNTSPAPAPVVTTPSSKVVPRTVPKR